MRRAPILAVAQWASERRLSLVLAPGLAPSSREVE